APADRATGSVTLARRRDGDPTTALAAPVVEDEAALGGAHPRAEAVGAQALDAMGLVGTLHGNPPAPLRITAGGAVRVGRAPRRDRRRRTKRGGADPLGVTTGARIARLP